MKGTKEYWPWLESGFFGQLQIDKGTHARGNTLRIYVVDPEFQHTDLSSNRVEVFGVVRGNPGWTEEYDWIIRGPWVQDVEDMVQRNKEAKAKATMAEAERKEKAQQEKIERENQILASYKQE